jgi:hypothetical protein
VIAVWATTRQPHMRTRRVTMKMCGSAGVLAPLFCVAAAGWAAACTLPEGFTRLGSADGEIAYRLVPEQLKVGQFFAAEVIACRAPGAEAISEILLDAQMPAHGHGMNYRPSAERLAADRFRITGLLLHMPGRWKLNFDLVQGGRRTRLSRELEVKP